ncbi:peptidase [Rhodococcus sp. OK519]|uniref:PepSY domain-containing protein n=1 Tax=Rhodococcus sp. OK519 TaxID=2135729 RepID=UPI0021596E88
MRDVARSGAAVLCTAAAVSGVLLAGAGSAQAQESPRAPGILGFELDEEDGRPTVEIDFVDLQGERREIDVDLQTGRIVEDEPEDDTAAVAG